MTSHPPDSYRLREEPSERLRCLICYELAGAPVQHEDCGKVFCEKCLRQNGDRPCPNCLRANLNFFSDTRCELS